MDPLTTAAIGAGVSIFNNAMNSSNTNRANREGRNFTLDMYNRQRSDSLSDWAMENEYNSPRAQMQRLRDANLNPNMVYGHGATATSDSVRSSSAGNWSPTPVNTDLSGIGDSLRGYYDTKLREAQTNATEAATTVSAQDAILRAAQVQKTLADTGSTQFDLDLKKELKEISVDYAKEQLGKLRSDKETVDLNNWIKGQTQDDEVKKVIEQAKQSGQQTDMNEIQKKILQSQLDNLQKDGKLKTFEIDLKKNGVGSNDPIYFRVLARILSAAGLNISGK